MAICFLLRVVKVVMITSWTPYSARAKTPAMSAPKPRKKRSAVRAVPDAIHRQTMTTSIEMRVVRRREIPNAVGKLD
jgi:hypothetical protein